MNFGSGCRVIASLALLGLGTVFAAPASTPPTVTTSSARKYHRKKPLHSVSVHPVALTALATTRPVAHASTTAASRRGHHHVFVNPWTEPTYGDPTLGDSIDGEDLVVRKAAADALGSYNGTVVVVDPQTGRILSIVNQNLALRGAFQPCSTVKVVISLASLNERIIAPTTPVHIARRFSMDMTQALARSNNLYFAKLGQELGFERVQKYGKLFGLGERAGLDIPGEQAGYLTSEPPSTGVGMMTSFGDGIRLTPLELASIVSTIANGGTMYYLQYPKNQEEVEKFIPRIKRTLDIGDLIPQIRPGMRDAVEFGTATRANYDPNEPIFGKTGTCSDTARPGVHLGWFGSFNDIGNKKVVVVVLLTGGRGISGPIASGIAGNVYHNLSQQHYFSPGQQPAVPSDLLSMQNCCRP